MNPFFVYLIKSTISLALFYIVFKLAVSRDKMHTVNRFVLLGILITSAILPFAEIPVLRENQVIPQVEVFRQIVEVPVFNNPLPAVSGEIQTVQPTDTLSVNPVLLIYLVAIILLLIRLVISLVRVAQLIKKAEKQSFQNYMLAVVKDFIQPFSFLRNIVISEKDYTENKEMVITHEYAHIKHFHAIDLVICELFTALHWFNPFVWLLRRDLKLIHEYQADQAVLNKGIDATKYQLLVIEKAVGERRFAMANHFTQKPILKRIKMMKKKKLNRWTGIKLVLFVPITLLLLQAFVLISCKSEQTKINGTYRFVSEEYITNGIGSKVLYDKDNGGLKTWSDKYVLWVNSSSRGDGGGELGGGTYQLNGNHYTENFQHHASISFRGVSLKMHLEMKGDTVVQIWPCDQSFNYDKNNCVVHKYVRVD
jgi:hypothetical protein